MKPVRGRLNGAHNSEIRLWEKTGQRWLPKLPPSKDTTWPQFTSWNTSFLLSVPSLAPFYWNKPWFRSVWNQGTFSGKQQRLPAHGFLQTGAHGALLTCRVWLKRFSGVAFTGGMRFASDVTLERGLTRLLLGSCRIKKRRRKKWKCPVGYEENITPPQVRPTHELHRDLWNANSALSHSSCAEVTWLRSPKEQWQPDVNRSSLWAHS